MRTGPSSQAASPAHPSNWHRDRRTGDGDWEASGARTALALAELWRCARAWGVPCLPPERGRGRRVVGGGLGWAGLAARSGACWRAGVRLFVGAGLGSRSPGLCRASVTACATCVKRPKSVLSSPPRRPSAARCLSPPLQRLYLFPLHGLELSPLAPTPCALLLAGFPAAPSPFPRSALPMVPFFLPIGTARVPLPAILRLGHNFFFKAVFIPHVARCPPSTATLSAHSSSRARSLALTLHLILQGRATAAPAAATCCRRSPPFQKRDRLEPPRPRKPAVDTPEPQTAFAPLHADSCTIRSPGRVLDLHATSFACNLAHPRRDARQSSVNTTRPA